MTTFAGFDCLMAPPNAVSAWDSSTGRTVDRAENAQGNVVTTTRSDVGRDTRTLTWNCATRADLTALRVVLDARFGSLVPLWIPTYQRDLHVTAVDGSGNWTVDLGSNALAIVDLIDTATAWHYWTAFRPGSSRYFVYRAQYTDLGSSLYRLESGMGGPLDVNGPWSTSATSPDAIFSRLMLCRLTGGYRVDVLGAVAVVTAEFTQVTAGS